MRYTVTRANSNDGLGLLCTFTNRTVWMAAAAVSLSMAFVSYQARATDVQPGVDLWVTPSGASYDTTPIPAGFFSCSSGGSSLVYTAGMCLQGTPIQTDPPFVIFPADTIVQRLAPARLPTCPSTDTVPIEIVALQLVSCVPITVQCDDGTSDQWDVDVCLAPNQTIGSMKINHDCPSGGTYEATLPVLPQFTFTRTSDGFQDTYIPDSPVVLTGGAHWSHFDPTGGLLLNLPAGMFVDTDCDGAPDNGTYASTLLPEGFYPGLTSLDCTCNNSNASFQKQLTVEQERWATHGIFVANQEKPQAVGACCDPDGNCRVTGQFNCQPEGYRGDAHNVRPTHALTDRSAVTEIAKDSWAKTRAAARSIADLRSKTAATV